MKRWSRKQAIAHLKKTDRKLAKVIERVGPYKVKIAKDGTNFHYVIRAIVFQQLSGKAATTIHNRFLALFGDAKPTPEQILALADEKLRAVGLSGQKTKYVKDLAAKVKAGEIAIEALDKMTDLEVITELTKVKGVGVWTAQMFLMFRLHRPNVMPGLDLGIQKGMQKLHGLKKLPKPDQVVELGKAWEPYCTVACWYLWRSLEEK